MGIDIAVDVSWLIIFALLSISLLAHFRLGFPQLTSGILWIASIVTTLVFFGSLLLHELSHSVVARKRGVTVRGITLFLFGGVSELRDEPRRPLDEFLIAIVGPVASIVLAVFFFALRALVAKGSLGWDALGWLGTINVFLAGFNLLPGFPLDGGRILRSAAWGLTGDLRGATRLASFLGAVIAFGFVLLGVLLAFGTGRFVDGLWLGLIGWFLFAASRQGVTQVELRDRLSQLRVEQAMKTNCPEVGAEEPVDRFVDEYVLRRGGKCFFVAEGGALQGLVTLDEVRRVPREAWSTTRLADVMIPAGDVTAVAPHDSLLVAFERMNQGALNQLPVVEGGSLRGILTRNDLLRSVALFLELTERPAI
jgi:Zn-dependent protease/predicted transcriptional regulator